TLSNIKIKGNARNYILNGVNYRLLETGTAEWNEDAESYFLGRKITPDEIHKRALATGYNLEKRRPKFSNRLNNLTDQIRLREKLIRVVFCFIIIFGVLTILSSNSDEEYNCVEKYNETTQFYDTVCDESTVRHIIGRRTGGWGGK
ncbi:hypothetical protein P3G55_07670, partial [Leptospira sp. 96542]|nr:hypothetical protein [Leptospira sp. 96542]